MDACAVNPKTKIVDTGAGNRISLPENYRGAVRINVTGSNCIIEIGASPKLGLTIMMAGDGSVLKIGENTTSGDTRLFMHEAGSVTIGRDCMLSGDIWLSNSDMHSIVDADTGERFNWPEDVVIGDHVWIGRGVTVTKGSRIGDGAIIGARSVVTGEIAPYSLAVGVPARVIRSNVTWDRKRLEPGQRSGHRRGAHGLDE